MIDSINEIFLLLGANLGDREKCINQAIGLIENEIGEIQIKSSLYETEAWGHTVQPSFLNQVIKVKSNLNALEVLKILLKIEEKSGRIRTYKNAPRIIDIDILFFNEDIYNFPQLKIPHPEIQNRKFALWPVEEIAPFLIHPVFKKSITDLLKECKDNLKVERLVTT